MCDTSNAVLSLSNIHQVHTSVRASADIFAHLPTLAVISYSATYLGRVSLLPIFYIMITKKPSLLDIYPVAFLLQVGKQLAMHFFCIHTQIRIWKMGASSNILYNNYEVTPYQSIYLGAFILRFPG